MDAAVWGFIGTLLGAVVGAAASILTTSIAASNARKLQSDADSLLRLERAREFQRATLLELQDALAANARLVGRAHLEDLDFYRKHPDSSARPRLSNALDQDLAESNRRISILTERISNDALRTGIKELRRTMDEVFDARSAEQSDQALTAIGKPFLRTMEKLGDVLRTHY